MTEVLAQILANESNNRGADVFLIEVLAQILSKWGVGVGCPVSIEWDRRFLCCLRGK